MSRRRRMLVIGLVGGAVALGIGLAVFQPWLLVVDVEVRETLPSTAPTPTAEAETPPPGPVALSTGEFISHEHATTGTATVVENPDGTRELAIAGLDTSNGPDLHVWLSASEVVPGTAGWYLAGDAAYVDLGPLKGNLGDQVYEIPADADLGTLRSVVIWCVRFSVSFGAAALA